MEFCYHWTKKIHEDKEKIFIGCDMFVKYFDILN